jgi:hypothetical protein
MVVISYLYFVSILEVLVAKLHVAEWARKDLATTELCVQQKVCSFGSFKILSLFLLDCPALLMDEMAPFSEHPDH